MALALMATAALSGGCSRRIPRGWKITQDPSGSCEVATPSDWQLGRQFFFKRHAAETVSHVPGRLPAHGFGWWDIARRDRQEPPRVAPGRRFQIRTSLVRGEGVCSVWRIQETTNFTAAEKSTIRQVGKTLRWVIATAGLLIGTEGGAGTSWTGTSTLDNHQNSDGTEHISDQSHQTSSDGQQLDDQQTLDRNPDGSTHEAQDLGWGNGKGDEMQNHTTWDTDKDGNLSRHIEDSYTDPEGNKTTITTDETFDSHGNRRSWKGNSKREKVAPPKRFEPKKEEPEEPEKPKPPKPPKASGSGSKPHPNPSPAEGVQVTLSLHATAGCQTGLEAVNLSASGVLPLDVNPMGFTIAGNLTIQELKTSDFSCPRTYYEQSTKREVGGEWQVTIEKQNPTVFVGLTAIEPLGLGFQMPAGAKNEQDLRGTLRAGRVSTVDVIRGGRYDAHRAGFDLLFGNAPPLMRMTPIPSLMRADLSDGFSSTFTFQGSNYVTVADAGEDRPQPFSGTGMSGELNTTGQLTLTYKGGGRGPAQRPPTSQSGDEEEILGMVVVDEPPNRPGGVPGVLVKRVDPKRYSMGPGAAAPGDVIFAVNQKPVTCVDDLQKIVGQSGGKPLSIMVMRSGSPVSFTLSQK